MSEPVEIEGIWEEIAARGEEFRGRRVKLTVLSAEREAPRLVMPEGAETMPIEQVILALAAQVPDEEWQKLPDDFSDQIDHYVYGTPRRPVA